MSLFEDTNLRALEDFLAEIQSTLVFPFNVVLATHGLAVATDLEANEDDKG
jgi:hypothetical protein